MWGLLVRTITISAPIITPETTATTKPEKAPITAIMTKMRIMAKRAMITKSTVATNAKRAHPTRRNSRALTYVRVRGARFLV